MLIYNWQPPYNKEIVLLKCYLFSVKSNDNPPKTDYNFARCIATLLPRQSVVSG
jgi:hypothetical protein